MKNIRFQDLLKSKNIMAIRWSRENKFNLSLHLATFHNFGNRYRSTLCALGACSLLLNLSGCQHLSTSNSQANNISRATNIEDRTETIIWSDNFASPSWQQNWQIRPEKNWGLENTTIVRDSSGKFDNILRVFYPAGSASPTVHRQHKAPLGGTGFYAELETNGARALRLTYYVRFSENFNFVKGGKLPGLFGGEGASGGKIPDGTNGFSTRFMWRKHGNGEVYAYLPTSSKQGTSIGRNNWQFQPNRWYRLEQEVSLNDPNLANGRIQVWLDGRKVLDRGGLTFRHEENLTIDGVFFSTFFGGGDPSWATPKDVYIDFANFSVSRVRDR